ncbi:MULTISPECIES: peptidase inhibitor family I36 protein [Streptomyces]|uniref:Peptidase inhibitor family I36 protein n=1 Tax=Streptomyces luteosporeus TaxID=173856 RepID=A0ABP6FY46_9ACTN
MALRTWATAAAAAALAASLIGANGTASAAPAATAARPDFAAQAASAGLSGSRAEELQHKVDDYLARLGGRQVAANKVEFEGGTVVVALPGEKQARDLGKADAKFADCPYENFCMFRGTYYTGDQLNLYYCRDQGLTNWTGNGSWWNRQTPGTQARLLGRNHDVVTVTAGAESWQAVYNWDPIWYVRPC